MDPKAKATQREGRKILSLHHQCRVHDANLAQCFAQVAQGRMTGLGITIWVSTGPRQMFAGEEAA